MAEAAKKRQQNVLHIVTSVLKTYMVTHNYYTLVDGRDTRAFNSWHIPGAISIPEGSLDEPRAKLPADKNRMMIFYCFRPTCDISDRMAKSARKLGYKNVRRYIAGADGWKNAGYTLVSCQKNAEMLAVKQYSLKSITTSQVQSLMKSKENYMIIDGRNTVVHKEGHIPDSVSIPSGGMNVLRLKLPAVKYTKLVFYCYYDGCGIGDQMGNVALRLGYNNVYSYRAGARGWENAGLSFAK